MEGPDGRSTTVTDSAFLKVQEDVMIDRFRHRLFLSILAAVFLIGMGCTAGTTPLQMSRTDPPAGPPKIVVFPNGLAWGGASGAQAVSLARILVESHNMAVQQRQRLEESVALQGGELQRLREAFEKNLATARMAYGMLSDISQKQGAGEITLFFPVDSARIPKGSDEYHRLVRFADALALKSNGRKIHFLCVGSASAFGPKERNEKLAEARARAPVEILDHYLVKIPHEFHQIYGTGDLYSPPGVPMKEHMRYQHVHITAFWGEEAPRAAGASPTERGASPAPAAAAPPQSKEAPEPPAAPTQRWTNSLGMSFVYIPPGSFTMGSPPDEPRRYEGERQHQVTLTKGFYLQTTEVTQGQWRALMGENPSYFRNCGDDCPVEGVTWYDAQAFIRKLNEKEGSTAYRLPTEAEWEYACRAGSTTAFANGPMIQGSCGKNPYLDRMGWYFRNSDQGTHPVAQKEPNAWGLYDMHGNVWEWCQDWQADYPFTATVDPVGPPSGHAKIRRGGSWSHYPMFNRCAYRSWYDPANGSAEIGFRVARDAQAALRRATPETSRPAAMEVTEECIVLRDVIFDFDSARIRPDMFPVLDKAVQIIRPRNRPIRIEGHTCSLGSDAYNQTLSERRAASVRDYLVRRGIAAESIQAVGYGESRPKYSNATEAGRRLNRRVEIYFR
jgi:formylglycine-generating enzyme required for sulfatase activity